MRTAFLTSGQVQLASLLLIQLSLADNAPKGATWASTPVGPDGPWNAVSVTLGDSSQPLALFPGHTWQTVVTTSDYCALNASTPHCTAGSYSKDKAILDKFQGLSFKPGIQDTMAGVEMKGKTLDTYFDTCNVIGNVPNCSLSLVTDQMMAYPGGRWFPLFAGCLSIGAQAENQTYSRDNEPPLNGSIYPWYLYNQKSIPSSSFGMHIGSAAAASSLTGSLYFGGYDKNRINGNMLSFEGSPSGEILLTDVGISVVKGKSPFAFANKSGLLAGGNSSIPQAGLPVTVDGCSPYLTLPKSTCDGIASNLPVTYNDSLGLYLWNTQDAQYKAVINSASVLSFSFMGSNNKQSLTINVPFQHLNLTLEPPLVDKPVPYLPCSTGGTGHYVLGRAFLQDAFLGANWHNKLWWLAQAPGPNIPVQANLAVINPSDTTITGGSNDWSTSWDRVWTKLATGDAAPSTTATSQDNQKPSSLSAGAIAGIAVGVVAAVILVGLVVFVLWRRKRRATPPVISNGNEKRESGYTYTQPPQPPMEVAGSIPHNQQEQQYQRYELS